MPTATGAREPSSTPRSSDDADSYTGRHATGLGVDGGVGVEFLRLYSSRLLLDVRVDAPFFEVDGEEYDYSAENGASERRERSSYEVPVMIGLTFMW